MSDTSCHQCSMGILLPKMHTLQSHDFLSNVTHVYACACPLVIITVYIIICTDVS